MIKRFYCKHPKQIVTDGEIMKIHQATLEVLAEKGVRFEDDQALGLLAEHGCRVDPETKVVKIPGYLVEACIKKCPSEFTLRARNPENNILISPQSVYFGPHCGMQILDDETLTPRPGTFADGVKAAQLINAVDEMAVANTGVAYLQDKPLETNMEWLYAIDLRNSDKVFSAAVEGASTYWAIKMAQAAETDMIISVSAASPLSWNSENISGARLLAKAGMPLGIQSMASPGLTSPATLAGSAVIMNAEILAMVVFLQLLKPGLGLMYSCFNIPMDMRTTALASGSIEFGMMTALSAQLSKFYGMGSFVYAPLTDAKMHDEQAGYEKAMQYQLFAASGINIAIGAGVIENQTLWSNAQLIVEAELCNMAGHLIDGIEITDETLAVDLIKTVGYPPDNYLSRRHTLEWFRREQFIPMVSSRESRGRWEEKGKKDVLLLAGEKAREILKKHEPIHLPDDVDRELDDLLLAALKEKRK